MYTHACAHICAAPGVLRRPATPIVYLTLSHRDHWIRGRSKVAVLRSSSFDVQSAMFDVNLHDLEPLVLPPGKLPVNREYVLLFLQAVRYGSHDFAIIAHALLC